MRNSSGILTVFYHFLPRHPESFGPTYTSGKAGRSTERRHIESMEIAAKKLKTRDAQQFFFKNNNGNFSNYTNAI